MRHDELLLQYLRSLQENPAPHAVAYTRRQLLRRAGRLALGMGALATLAACGSDAGDGAPPPTTSGAATTPAPTGPTPELPEMTSIPEALKGSGEVRVVSYGGAFQEAQRKAYFEPFQRLSGIKVIDTEGPTGAKVKAMVDTGNVEWDVVELGRGTVIELEGQGEYWEPIDYDLVDTDNIDEAFRYPFSLDMLPYAQIYAYRTDAFSEKPSGWADFWDTERFPGPRTMPGTGGITPDFEAAVIAAGVAPSEVYPIDIDLGFESMTKIKPAVVKWWDAGAIPAQMLTDQEVVMGIAWNGRIAAIQDEGAPVEIAWSQGTLRNDCWAVPKGTPNLENAMKFIAFTTLPISQARLSMLIPYGFVNNKATEYLSQERLQILPTAPEIREQLVVYDYQWWAENRGALIERWNTWLLE